MRASGDQSFHRRNAAGEKLHPNRTGPRPGISPNYFFQSYFIQVLLNSKLRTFEYSLNFSHLFLQGSLEGSVYVFRNLKFFIVLL